MGDDAPTANDPGDPDAGPNNLQNYPVILRAEPGMTTRVLGSLDSTPGTIFTLDFYVSSEADPSGFGEGERWLDSAVVTTDAAGNVSFDVVLAAVTVSEKVITATATDPMTGEGIGQAIETGRLAASTIATAGSDIRAAEAAAAADPPMGVLAVQIR